MGPAFSAMGKSRKEDLAMTWDQKTRGGQQTECSFHFICLFVLRYD